MKVRSSYIEFKNNKRVEGKVPSVQHYYNKELAIAFLERMKKTNEYTDVSMKEEKVNCPSCNQITTRYSVNYSFIDFYNETELTTLEELEKLLVENALDIYLEEGVFYVE